MSVSGVDASIGVRDLTRRLESCPDLAGDMLNAPALAAAESLPREFVVTGVGSSAAHARFLAHLFAEYTDIRALFAPLSRFHGPLPVTWRKRGLAVFSQGLSPNVTLAIQQACRFERCVLFTAVGSSRTGARTQDHERLRSVPELEFVHFPLEDEYTTLTRVVGPLLGCLAALRYVERVAPGALGAVSAEQIVRALENAQQQGVRFAECAQVVRNAEIAFLACPPWPELGSNLQSKFVEGLFWPQPPIWDALEFAHGPYQQWLTRRRPVMILESEPNELLERARSMLEPEFTLTLRASLPGAYALLEFEYAISWMVVKLIERFGVDQIAWPGRGSDGPLYDYARSGANC